MAFSSVINSFKSVVGLFSSNNQDESINPNYLTADPNGSSWRDFQFERNNNHDETNGLVLHGVLVPETILEIILSKLPLKTILEANKVCRAWKDIIVLKSFWKKVYDINNCNWENVPSKLKGHKNSWIAFYAEAKYGTFTRNFIKNHSGKDGFANWLLNDDNNRGGIWIIENTPKGCNPLLPDPMFGNTSCFVSTYQHCYLIQQINLYENGLSPAIMKMAIPFKFQFSLMTAPRFDCSSEYDVVVHLINSKNKETLASDTIEGIHDRGIEWKNEAIEIPSFTTEEEGDIYPDKIVVKIRAKDRQFWAGHYGAKISRVCLKVNID